MNPMERMLATAAFVATAAVPGGALAGDGWDYFDVPNGMRKAVAEGKASCGASSEAAALRVQCQPGTDGVVCIGFKLEGAKSVKDFDFALFEGPDAPARGKKLLRATVGAAAVESPVEGSYNKEGAFIFELCGKNHGASDAATLARALAAGAGAELSVREPVRTEREIRGTFPGDSAAGAVSRALRGCLKE